MNNKNLFPKLIIGFTLILISRVCFPAVYNFDFKGRFTVINPNGDVVTDAGNAGVYDELGMQTPISASLQYDTTLGVGSADLFIAPFDFFGGSSPVTIHSMSLEDMGNNLILGNFLADWNSNYDMPISVVWDATGLFNAFSSTTGGLQVGDVISGNVVKRDGEVINADLQSAIPATDGITVTTGNSREGFIDHVIDQGPAPMAMTTWNTTSLCTPVSPGSGECLGVNPIGGLPLINDGVAGSPMVDGPFPGMNINLDIGSGNSMVVIGVSAVPLPPAVWLFGSGLLGLVGIARRRVTA